MKRFIAPIFFILVSTGVFMGYILPTYNAIQILKEKKGTLQSSIKDAGTAKEKIDKLAATEASFPVDYIVNLRTLLPDTIDTTRLIIDVNAFAVERGFRIPTPVISVLQSPSKGGGSYVKHSITFTVKATYANFKPFLIALEQNLSLRDMSSFSFSSQETDEDALRYRDPAQVPHAYTLTLITYSLH